MTIEDVFMTFPMLLVPVIFWTAYKVIQIENKLMARMNQDITEIKTDIKWLVEKHRNGS